MTSVLATVVRPAAVPKLLTSRELRSELLLGLGAEVLCMAPFDYALSQWSPRRFCCEVLRDLAQTRILVVGRNFVLGRGRTGTVSVLEDLGKDLGFEVLPFESVRLRDSIVSSSRIREHLREGRVELDGRLHTLLVSPMAGFYNVAEGEENPGRTQMRIAYVEEPERMKLVPELFARLLGRYGQRRQRRAGS